MRVFSAELIKLKRSLSWPVVIGLPVAVVLLGAATNLARGEQPVDGWHGIWGAVDGVSWAVPARAGCGDPRLAGLAR